MVAGGTGDIGGAVTESVAPGGSATAIYSNTPAGLSGPAGQAMTGQRGGNLIVKGLQAIIGTRMYETWLLQQVTRVDASSAMRPLHASSMAMRVPYSINEDVPAQVAEAAARTGLTSATFGAYTPSFTTFRTLQTVSNELMADAKIIDIIGYQMAMNLAEQCQAYLLAQVGASVVNTARHHREAPGANNTGTTDGIPRWNTLIAMVSGTPIAATWTTAVGGGIAAETILFTNEERKQLVMASHPAALSTIFTNSTGQLNNTGGGHITAANDLEQRGVPNPIMGVPWYTDPSLPKPSNAGVYGDTPHILIFNPNRLLLAVKQEVMVSLDTESLLESNQTVIHASYRAAASMMNPKSAAAYSLKAIPAQV